FMPVEFAVGAYRFGHTLVRPSYQINARANSVQLFSGGRDRLDAGHLDGFRPLPGRLTIDWGWAPAPRGGPRPRPGPVPTAGARFPHRRGPPPPQPARRLDTKLSQPLAGL